MRAILFLLPLLSRHYLVQLLLRSRASRCLVDKRKAGDVIYLNFSKTFGTISHDILPEKLAAHSLDSVDLLEGGDNPKKDLDRLELLAEMIGLRFNNTKFFVLHFDHNNPRQCHSATERLESDPAEMDLGMVVDSQMDFHAIPTGPITGHQREWISVCPSASPCEEDHDEVCNEKDIEALLV
ncbi:hypothetical protein DUI87_16363 [Hirundo rustica rustica]|uniref:Reverse transcriptase domain-containing protein n=1 Tax=Hirundo rustica rustica TaxID=333673 RepID=A0A3M0K171_HIRRU|nr:hypothetical protein DUI87_16363 [Hirundo rustica rustica]